MPSTDGWNGHYLKHGGMHVASWKLQLQRDTDHATAKEIQSVLAIGATFSNWIGQDNKLYLGALD